MNYRLASLSVLMTLIFCPTAYAAFAETLTTYDGWNRFYQKVDHSSPVYSYGFDNVQVPSGGLTGIDKWVAGDATYSSQAWTSRIVEDPYREGNQLYSLDFFGSDTGFHIDVDGQYNMFSVNLATRSKSPFYAVKVTTTDGGRSSFHGKIWDWDSTRRAQLGFILGEGQFIDSVDIYDITQGMYLPYLDNVFMAQTTQPSPTPLPPSVLLFGTGILGIVGFRTRQIFNR